MLFVACLYFAKTSQAQDSILDRRINFPKQQLTLYELLTQITDSTGYFFIYDSKILDSDKKVKVDFDQNTIKQALDQSLNDHSLSYKVIEKHILIFKKQEGSTTHERKDSTQNIIVSGKVFDKKTKEPLSFVTVGITDKNIGTISNSDGFFTFKIPSNYINSLLTIAHLGYKNQQLPIKLLSSQKVDIYLETEYISLQEVIIRNIDPLSLVKKAIQNFKVNYSIEPIYITSFYREGVTKNNKYLNYSEAILKVYKSSYTRGYQSDQIKLLKSRKILNVDQSDTLILKIKSGLKSSLTLDIVKSLPDFIDLDYLDNYNYSRFDIVSIDSRNAYAIAFEQKESITDPLYKGVIYIDTENFAIVGADFEVNPKYIKDADNIFIVKKSKNFTAKPEKISYKVSYSLRNGKYYISHIRGELNIKFKRKYQLFYGNFNAYLELASCQIDTTNVVRFNKEEAMKTNTIFLDAKYVYDESFWGDFNTIVPEEKLSVALSRINSKIEEVKP